MGIIFALQNRGLRKLAHMSNNELRLTMVRSGLGPGIRLTSRHFYVNLLVIAVAQWVRRQTRRLAHSLWLKDSPMASVGASRHNFFNAAKRRELHGTNSLSDLHIWGRCLLQTWGPGPLLLFRNTLCCLAMPFRECQCKTYSYSLWTSMHLLHFEPY